MNLCKAIGTSLVGVLLASASMLATSAPAHAASAPTQRTNLGGLQLDRYCQATGYWNVILEENSILGRKCEGATERASINTHSPCRWLYDKPAALPGWRNYNEPYSWYCYIP
jgi:hypothetical protein